MENHLVHTEQPIQATSGTEVRLALRPEELSLGHSEGNNHLNGRVESVTFLGAIVRMRVSVGSQVISVDRFNERQFTPPKTGEQVEINFPPQSCWIMH
jgi:putative spermidine/putrescine transport system ATP-binding protein